MLVMTLEIVPPRLRGLLSRWLIEIQTGVYVGGVNKVVRDLLWSRAIELDASGRITQSWNTNNEQGFEFRIHGDGYHHIVEIDGLMLVGKRNARAEQRLAPKRAAKRLAATRKIRS